MGGGAGGGGAGEGEQGGGYVLSFFLAGVTPLQALTYVRACLPRVHACVCIGIYVDGSLRTHSHLYTQFNSTKPHNANANGLL